MYTIETTGTESLQPYRYEIEAEAIPYIVRGLQAERARLATEAFEAGESGDHDRCLQLQRIERELADVLYFGLDVE